MAVPRGDNGLMEEDDVDAVIEENGVDYESDPELSSNLRDLAAASQSGDVVALRTAIGTFLADPFGQILVSGSPSVRIALISLA